MDTDLYDLGHLFYIATGQGCPAIVGYEIWVILHALRPVTLDPKSLDLFSPHYNPVISDDELSDLRIQFHHLDIETGDVLPSSIPCFLPKTDFPEVLDRDNFYRDDFYPHVFEGVEEEILSLKERGRSKTSNINSSDIFPAGLTIGESFEALRMVPYRLRTLQRNRLGTPDQQTYRWAMADVGTCGDNSRPSRDEVAALSCTMLDCMWQANLSIQEERSRQDDMFPTLLITLDCYGRARVIAGYFDGQLHIQFSRMLGFGEFAVVPPEDTPYIDFIDRSKFYDMINTLLKWSWPIPVATTKEYVPVILDLPTDDRPDTDLADEDWLLVQDVTD